VPHTGQLKDENREQEVWIFGEPDSNHGIQSENIKVVKENNLRKLIVPDNIRIKQFG